MPNVLQIMSNIYSRPSGAIQGHDGPTCFGQTNMERVQDKKDKEYGQLVYTSHVLPICQSYPCIFNVVVPSRVNQWNFHIAVIDLSFCFSFYKICLPVFP